METGQKKKLNSKLNKVEVRIKVLPKKNLVGKSVKMSLADNKTGEVWRSFQKHKSAITNAVGTDLYSIQVYDDSDYFENFNPRTEFIKWAATEVKGAKNVPNGFVSFILQEGLYAVFLHKGTSDEFPKTFQFILSQWLPKSEYELDYRPHFELLGEKYKKDDPNSEEEVWIPIRKRPS